MAVDDVHRPPRSARESGGGVRSASRYGPRPGRPSPQRRPAARSTAAGGSAAPSPRLRRKWKRRRRRSAGTRSWQSRSCGGQHVGRGQFFQGQFDADFHADRIAATARRPFPARWPAWPPIRRPPAKLIAPCPAATSPPARKAPHNRVGGRWRRPRRCDRRSRAAAQVPRRPQAGTGRASVCWPARPSRASPPRNPARSAGCRRRASWDGRHS